ncbi:MAG TPA: type II toxin-antitoxin system RelE/ParE family toxin [Vicingaceae bacterium]|nr:type II toxin-antitoxin system RelE/ParE family toxin [Vicingaceae bacterium]
MVFKIKIDAAAKLDIQEAINWYNEQQKGLGKKFHKAVLSHFEHLKKNPFFENRYDKVHCLPIKKFPFMIHFTVNEKDKLIIVRAVFHTSLNPDIWRDR